MRNDCPLGTDEGLYWEVTTGVRTRRQFARRLISRGFQAANATPAKVTSSKRAVPPSPPGATNHGNTKHDRAALPVAIGFGSDQTSPHSLFREVSW